LVKTLIACDVLLGVLNNSEENRECLLMEKQKQNNIGVISSSIVRRVSNPSVLIA